MVFFQFLVVSCSGAAAFMCFRELFQVLDLLQEGSDPGPDLILNKIPLKNSSCCDDTSLTFAKFDLKSFLWNKLFLFFTLESLVLVNK